MLKNYDTIEKDISDLRKLGKKLVFTNGCFDLLHHGHKDLLSASSSFGDALIVGLNSDLSVRRLKGNDRPIQSEIERKTALVNTGFVNKVYIFQDESPIELIELIRPDVLVKGGDYIPNEIIGYEEVLDWGGQIEVIPITPGFSTTSIIENMK